MPGSLTTPGRSGTRDGAPARVAFRHTYNVGAQDIFSFAAQWLAYAIPYRRFAAALTDDNARLGANVDRYSFIATDSHRLLLASLPAHKYAKVCKKALNHMILKNSTSDSFTMKKYLRFWRGIRRDCS